MNIFNIQTRIPVKRGRKGEEREVEE